jgi:hypothetical protein
VLAGEEEGLPHAVALDVQRDLAGVLLDDREEVAQEATLGGGQVGVLDRRVVLRALEPVDRVALDRHVGLTVRGGGRSLRILPGLDPRSHPSKG